MTTIKGRTKTYGKKKTPTCNKDTHVTYEIEWHYTTNLSGKQKYIYTGKEIGKDYFDPGEQKFIRVGDTVIYKKKDHLNDGVEATVSEITKALTKKELAEKNLSSNYGTFNDSYSLKFKNPPIREKYPRQFKTLKYVQKVNLEKIPGHKDYICVRSNIDLKKATRKNVKKSKKLKAPVSTKDLKTEIIRQMKKTFKTEAAFEHMEGKEQPEFKISKVLAKNTYGKEVIDKFELVEPTQNYVLHSVGFRDIFKTRRSKSKSTDREYYIIKVNVYLGLKDTSVKYTSGDNISLALKCDERWNRINDIFREFKDESVEKIKGFYKHDTRTDKEIDKLVKSHTVRNVLKEKLRKGPDDIEPKIGRNPSTGELPLTDKERDELRVAARGKERGDDWQEFQEMSEEMRQNRLRQLEEERRRTSTSGQRRKVKYDKEFPPLQETEKEKKAREEDEFAKLMEARLEALKSGGRKRRNSRKNRLYRRTRTRKKC
jgi:hypothetical protein